MRRGQKGPNIEYVKVCPKFVQDIRDRLNPPSQLDDKKQKPKQQHEQLNDDDSYDIENAVLEGDEEDIENIKIQIQENKSKLDLDKFKPVFQNKKSRKEEKQEVKIENTSDKQQDESRKKNDLTQNNEKKNQDEKKKHQVQNTDKKKKVKQQSLLSFNADL